MASSTPNEIHTVIDHLFRHASGKMVSILTRVFGIHNLEMAEDVVQETLLKALQQWPYSGLPENPSAWLFQVAKNKALDVVRREKFNIKFSEDISVLLESEWTLSSTMNELFLEREIPDDQLRMIFTCCHPDLPEECQIALALKTLCGFSVAEIAQSFLSNEATINKRLYRAKQKISESHIRFEIPSGSELKPRLESVLSTLYLLFNEGYKSTQSDTLIRYDLVAESIRLVTLVSEHSVINDPQSDALLALMYFHAARLPSRVDDHGHILLLPEQDRTLWDQELIAKGQTYMERSARGDKLSAYHLEAAIALSHASARSFQETDWNRILQLYDLLCELTPSPVAALNRAIAVAQCHGPARAIAEIGKITDRQALEQYYLLPATLGELYYQLQDYDQAISYVRQALTLTDSSPERKFLVHKLRRIKTHELHA